MKYSIHITKILIFYLIPIGIYSQNLKSPESIIYDNKTKSFYLSSLEENFIFTIKDGISQKFISTPSSSLGINIYDNIIYVVLNFDKKDDEIRGYDMNSKDEVFKITIPNSKQLNDIEFDNKGNLYVSDRDDNIIYKINVKTKDFEALISKGLIDTPNGLYFDKKSNRLLICNTIKRSSIYSFDLNTKSLVTILDSEYSNFDGITMDNKKNIFVTSWSEDWSKSMLLEINNKNETKVILENKDGMADIFFSKKLKSILIANIYSHSYLIHKIVK